MQRVHTLMMKIIRNFLQLGRWWEKKGGLWLGMGMGGRWLGCEWVRRGQNGRAWGWVGCLLLTVSV